MGKICCKFFIKPKSPRSLSNHSQGCIEPQAKVGLDDFETRSLLGKGSFAKVVLVQSKLDNQLYAMKILKKKEISMRNEQQHILSERNILADTRNPFIVALKFAFQSRSKLFMVMEFMPGGELFYHLSRLRRFSEDTARFYIAEVIMGIEYLHSKNIIYRDLKPENILLGLDGHIKLTDFGLSKIVEENNFKTRTICGTPEYQAPEIIMNSEYDKAVDFWSIGCLMYELISGLPPFQDNDRNVLKNKILYQNLTFSRIFSESARNLIDKLLVKNPEYRLTDLNRLKSHEFFISIDWVKLSKKQIDPPYKPRQSGEIENFDKVFTTENPLSANMSPSPQSGMGTFPGFTYRDPSLII